MKVVGLVVAVRNTGGGETGRSGTAVKSTGGDGTGSGSEEHSTVVELAVALRSTSDSGIG